MEARATSSIALQHRDLMAQRDQLQHQRGAPLGHRLWGIAMNAGYPPAIETNNESTWIKF
jgi:hypothetical protein